MHDDVVRTLAATPDIVADILETLPEGAWTTKLIEDEWSLADVIGHLRAADSIWTPRILFALVHDGITLPDVDERALQDVQRAAEMDTGDQVTLYAFTRAELCGVLGALTEDAWSHAFTHEVRGAMTVIDACTLVARHEAEHLEQLRLVADALRESFEPPTQ